MAKKSRSKGKNEANSKTLTAGGLTRVTDVRADFPDIRDRHYEPPLIDLRVELGAPPPEDSPILDQRREGACTGFALASTINLLLSTRARNQSGDQSPELVSPRMLYEMAKLHDEWPGEDYSGSSIRGALKGFFNNGVCNEKSAPYRDRQRNWQLTIDQAKEAREIGLGAYYRLRPEVIDYHAALNEVGAICVSAHVHRGWRDPEEGVIKRSPYREGGHAFVIVGYDKNGFLIQNSWGPDWGRYLGKGGIAHWSYRDWAENIIDAWVLRLAVPTPDAFDLTLGTQARGGGAQAAGRKRPRPRRGDIAGHYIHVDDGELVEDGRYWTNLDSIDQTARLIANDRREKYDHLLFYAHGGLNGSDASARRIAAMKDVFKRNRIYPIHFMWETGFGEELTDIFLNQFRRDEERVASIRDVLDWTIEKGARPIGLRLWREMKRDAGRPFEQKTGGWEAVSKLLQANAQTSRPLKVHLVGHSAGSILLGELIKVWRRIGGRNTDIDSLSLMAPACTTDFYNQTYRKALEGNSRRKPLIRKLWQYNLVDSREKDDTVGPYGKSLLYLVSNAFEEYKGVPILGMETGMDVLTGSKALPRRHKVWYAGRDDTKTDSKVHGGFDNDRKTMNDVLSNVLGKEPDAAQAFQQAEMEGY